MPLWLWAKSICFRNYCKEMKLLPTQYGRNTRVQLTQWLINSKEKWKSIEKGTIHATIAPNDRYTISLIQKPRSFWTMANILPFGQIPDIPFIVRVIHRNARDGEEGGREGSGQAAKRRETLSICRLCIPLHSLAFTRYWFSVAREWAEGRGRKESKYNRGCLWSFCGVFALCLLLSALSLSLLEFVAQSAHFVRVPTPRTGAFIGDHHGLRPAPISVRTAALLLHSHYQSLRRIRPPLARKRTNQSVSQLQLNYAILSLLMRF